jgi:hypothetical protein
VIRSPQATSRGVLPVAPSVLPILPISNGNSQERAFATINTQETGLIRHGHVLAHQTKKDHGSGEAGAHVLFEHLDMRMILPMEEYSEVVRKLCLSGLPIYHVVSYTVGTYTLHMSLDLISRLIWNEAYSQAFYPSPENLPRTVFLFVFFTPGPSVTCFCRNHKTRCTVWNNYTRPSIGSEGFVNQPSCQL